VTRLADVPRPVRTCIGCRGQEDKAALLRIVWSGAGPLADPRQTAPGRGAYLHHSLDCLRLAVKRRSAGRALRVTGVDPSALSAAVEPHLGPSEQSGPGTTSRNGAQWA
jgi:predicted RNA-binding protein YlxR (DUF448 family)